MQTSAPTLWIIRPGVGLGDLRFGMFREDVQRYLGEPEDIKEHPIGSDLDIAWYYWDLGVSAHFGRDDNFRLDTLDVERADAELLGHRLIGLPVEHVRV